VVGTSTRLMSAVGFFGLLILYAVFPAVTTTPSTLVHEIREEAIKPPLGNLLHLQLLRL
jgi:hypothetical protein